jgi:uncharacterized RDD family membrane protein YckC
MSSEDNNRASRPPSAAVDERPGLAERAAGLLAEAGLRAGSRIAGRLGLDRAARTTVDRVLAGPLAERITRALVEQGVIERVTAELIDGGVPNRVIDQVLASRVPEEVIDRVLTEEFTRRVVARVLESPGLQPAAVEVIESNLVDELTKRVLESEEMGLAIERVAESPEVRNALARQGVGLLEDVGRQLSSAARRLDDAAELIPRRLARRPRRQRRPSEAGVISRMVALAIDALVLNAALFAASLAFALALSLLGGKGEVDAGALVAGGVVWVVGGATYLATFWTLAGQTPGMRFMRLRVAHVDGSGLTPRDSIKRLFGMFLAAIPFLLGYVLILFDDRRRGLQDLIARTLVTYVPEEVLALPPGARAGERELPPPGYHDGAQREPTKG